ncbi:hypothetical protein Plhal304r1_c016g0059091 [Plasmopara halstedii]
MWCTTLPAKQTTYFIAVRNETNASVLMSTCHIRNIKLRLHRAHRKYCRYLPKILLIQHFFSILWQA